VVAEILLTITSRQFFVALVKRGHRNLLLVPVAFVTKHDKNQVGSENSYAKSSIEYYQGVLEKAGIRHPEVLSIKPLLNHFIICPSIPCPSNKNVSSFSQFLQEKYIKKIIERAVLVANSK